MASDADRLRGLPRHERSEDSVPLDAGAAKWAIHDSGERGEAERPRGRREVRQACRGPKAASKIGSEGITASDLRRRRDAGPSWRLDRESTRLNSRRLR